METSCCGKAVGRSARAGRPIARGRAFLDDGRARRLTAAATISGALTILGYGAGALAWAPAMARVAEGLAVIVGLWLVLPRAVRAARRARPDMNLLMTVAVAGAIALGDWLEAATVSALFALSLALESWSARRARRAVEMLLDLAPPTARVKREEGGEVSVPPEEVAVGAVFVVLPGERIPLDGKVLAGASAVDESPITGESLPSAKGPGATVFAGSVNGEGALEILNLKPAQETTLAHVARLVEEAGGRRAAVERWVDRFAAVYTPVVMAVALGVVLVPPLLLGEPWGAWIYRALVLLVIACPCALVLSTPVTVVSAMASAARAGVLVKGGDLIERAASLRAVAFDKTGTLTLGRLRVEEIVALNGHSAEELLARAAALEARSTHPIARAILDDAAARRVSVPPAGDVRAVPGKGITGVVAGRAYWLGSHRFLEERGGETPEVHARAEALSRGGRSVVVVGSDAHVCGLLALSDAIRPGTREALSGLRGTGVTRLVLLTGDNRETADRIGECLGLDEIRAELLPADKVAAVEALVAEHGAVAMVGDGVNDAPALARATLGIAMGLAGTDVAVESADVALMTDDLGRLSWLVLHARRMLGVIRQNIAFALGVKAALAGLAFFGVASLWGAIVADMGVSLLVVFNGLRLLDSRTVSGPQPRAVRRELAA